MLNLKLRNQSHDRLLISSRHQLYKYTKVGICNKGKVVCWLCPSFSGAQRDGDPHVNHVSGGNFIDFQGYVS